MHYCKSLVKQYEETTKVNQMRMSGHVGPYALLEGPCRLEASAGPRALMHVTPYAYEGPAHGLAGFMS